MSLPIVQIEQIATDTKAIVAFLEYSVFAFTVLSGKMLTCLSKQQLNYYHAIVHGQHTIELHMMRSYSRSANADTSNKSSACLFS